MSETAFGTEKAAKQWPHIVGDVYDHIVFRQYMELTDSLPDQYHYALCRPYGAGTMRRRPIGEGIELSVAHYDWLKGTVPNETAYASKALEICLITGGSFSQTSLPDGEAIALERGDLIFGGYNADVLAYEIEAEQLSMITIMFDLERLDVRDEWRELLRCNMPERLKGSSYFMMPASPAVESLFRQLADIDNVHKTSGFFYWKGLAFQLLAQILELAERMSDRSAGLNEQDRLLLLRARTVLNQSPDNPPSLAMLARQCSMNTGKLKRAFKQMFGMTISEYILAVKAAAGKEKLGSTDKSVTEVALELGYRNPSKFSSMFKKHFGVTPREWRRSNRL